MKAANLEQALRFFDPKKPLSGQDLRFWYIPRDYLPRQRMKILLELSHEPLKILFVGHRGSGKTTELNKLSEELADRFYAIGFNVLDITGRTTPEYEDLMLAISTQVTLDCIRRGVVSRPLAEPVQRRWEKLRDWWRQIVAGASFEPFPAEASFSVQLQTLLGQVELGAKQSSLTRETLKFQINQKMPELIEHLNWVIEQAESGGKPLLLIVEGLDKVDLKSALDIFRDHAPTITAPRAHMIYTFPVALRHNDDYNTVRLSFPDEHILRNRTVHHRDEKPDQTSREFLEQLVRARLDEGLITAEALNLLVEANGGLPVWLVVLMRSATLFALERTGAAGPITVDDAHHAISELRRELMAPLSRRDLVVLRERHHDRQLSNGTEEQRLLGNGSLIEYTNDVQWCDAHPVLWNVLEQTEEGHGNASSVDN